jgi:hypothetical protein
VWGFRHEPERSPIWHALLEIANAESEGTGGASKLASRLRDAFRVAGSLAKLKVPENVERLSVLKHRIVHLFLPIDMNLQTAEELRREGQEGSARAETMSQGADASLEGKLVQARSLLDECGKLIGDKRMSLPFKRISELLSEKPKLQTQDFHQWLTGIDTALNELRETLRS